MGAFPKDGESRKHVEIQDKKLPYNYLYAKLGGAGSPLRNVAWLVFFVSFFAILELHTSVPQHPGMSLVPVSAVPNSTFPQHLVPNSTELKGLPKQAYRNNSIVIRGVLKQTNRINSTELKGVLKQANQSNSTELKGVLKQANQNNSTELSTELKDVLQQANRKALPPLPSTRTNETPWDHMVQPVPLETWQLTNASGGELLNDFYKAKLGAVITFNHSTVLWRKEVFLKAKRASPEEVNGTGYDLVVDTAFAMKRIQPNIQHFLFDDLVGLFGYIYLIQKEIAAPDVVLWAADTSKLLFQKNIFDLLAPRNHAVGLEEKVLVRKALYFNEQFGAIWQPRAFDWRHDLEGIPSHKPHGQRYVVLDELRFSLSRSLENRKTATNQCVPKSSTKLYSTRSQITASRKLINIKEYHSLLDDMGYTPWNPMDCSSLSDRYEALQNTRLLVSEYGSDMCNMLWLQRGATVVDLVHPGASYIEKHVPQDWNYGFFEAVAEGLGIRHEPIFAGRRRPNGKNHLMVREGHNFTLIDGTTITVTKDHPRSTIQHFPVRNHTRTDAVFLTKKIDEKRRETPTRCFWFQRVVLLQTVR